MDSASGQARDVARYRYNLFGQRIAKTVAAPAGAGGTRSRTTYYFYDGAQLVAEADVTGAVGKQYIWLRDKPVGLQQQGQLLAIHSDHRNAPLTVTDETRRVLWQASNSDYLLANPPQWVDQPQGIHTPDEPQTLGTIAFTIAFNLRGSGQYFDAESGLHYNTHRYFDPQAERYFTPDPMGLAVEPDLYAFALDRPHTVADPLGLQPVLSNRDVSDWSTRDRLAYSLEHATTQVPDAIGDVLREMASPAAIGTTVAIFGIWGAAQFTPYGSAADIAIAGIGYLFMGKGVWDVITGVYDLWSGLKDARCESDLRALGDDFARALVAGIGAGAGGAGIAKGSTKIANLLRRIFRGSKADATAAAATAAAGESWFGKFIPGRTRSGRAEKQG